jgi:hypothetical protein
MFGGRGETVPAADNVRLQRMGPSDVFCFICFSVHAEMA